MLFEFEDETLGKLEIVVDGDVYKIDIEDSSPLGYHYEYEVDNFHCMIFKDRECLHIDNIDKQTLEEIYFEAKCKLYNTKLLF